MHPHSREMQLWQPPYPRGFMNPRGKEITAAAFPSPHLSWFHAPLRHKDCHSCLPATGMQGGPMPGDPQLRGLPPIRDCFLVVQRRAQNCTGNKVQCHLTYDPTVVPPAMYVWHGKRCDCVNCILYLIVLLPGHVERLSSKQFQICWMNCQYQQPVLRSYMEEKDLCSCGT